jgi:dihydropyrimidinase
VYGGPHPERYILQPPLRDLAHAERLTQFVTEGAIDVLSTDSCDYSLAQKQAVDDFTKTPGGLPGLETLLPLMYSRFAETLGVPRLVQLLAENPARLFGLYPRKGAILPGSDADVVIYDPAQNTTVRQADLHYVAGYCPFEGMPIQGKVRTVLSRGAVIVRDGEFSGAVGRGRFLPGRASLDPQ